MKASWSRLALIVIVLAGCGREKYWERTLKGPFVGRAFTNNLTTPPTSKLRITADATLSVHFNESTNGPVLVMQDTRGQVLWMRLLVPIAKEEEQPQGRITTLVLNKHKTENDTIKIFVACDWTDGGRESGLIYLNKDASFRSFALGW